MIAWLTGTSTPHRPVTNWHAAAATKELGIAASGQTEMMCRHKATAITVRRPMASLRALTPGTTKNWTALDTAVTHYSSDRITSTRDEQGCTSGERPATEFT